MPKYRATIQVTGLTGGSPRAVRAALDAELHKSGIPGCRIVAIDIDAPPRGLVRKPSPIVRDPRRPANAGEVLIVVAATTVICLIWWMLSAVFD